MKNQKKIDFGASAGRFLEENLSEGAPAELPKMVSPREAGKSVCKNQGFNFALVFVSAIEVVSAYLS